MCNVVNSVESMKICKNDSLFKFINNDKNYVNIRLLIQAMSPKVYIGVFCIKPQKNRTDFEGVLRCVLVWIDEQL